MKRAKLPSSLRLWWWVATSLVLVTSLASVLYTVTTNAPYRARVTLQLTAPRDVDVSVLDANTSSTSTLRDDLTLVQNDLLIVVGNAEVRARTQQQLGLRGRDSGYSVGVSPLADSNFVDLAVSASSPEMARTIADAHAMQAIRFLGDLRARPALDTRQLLGAQLDAARAKLPSATPLSSSPADTADGQGARATYESLLKKYAQASLIADNAALASFIQVTSRATDIQHPNVAKRLLGLLPLALLGSLGLGGVVVLCLDRAFRHPRPEQSIPETCARCAAALDRQTRGFPRAAGYHPISRTNGHLPATVTSRPSNAAYHE